MVKIKGENQEVLKKNAEYKMVSSDQHCKINQMPYPIASWNCIENECIRYYTCKKINKNFNHGIEIAKLNDECAQMGLTKSCQVTAQKKAPVLVPLDKAPSRGIAQEQVQPAPNYQEKKVSTSAQVKENQKMFPLGLYIGYVDISGDNTDVSTINFSWVPKYEFDPNWALKGELGIQFMNEVTVNSNNITTNEDTFPVTPLAFYLDFLGSFFYVEAGGGFQWWYDQEQEFNPMASGGLGFRFQKPFLTIERIGFNYDYVWASRDLTQMRISFSFLF